MLPPRAVQQGRGQRVPEKLKEQGGRQRETREFAVGNAGIIPGSITPCPEFLGRTLNSLSLSFLIYKTGIIPALSFGKVFKRIE